MRKMSLPLLALLSFCLCSCRYAQTYRTPYAQMEDTLLQRFCIDKQHLIASQLALITVDPELADYMTMGAFNVVLKKYVPEEHLRFTAFHLYDIGAVGGQYITFDLRKIDDRKTRVAVNYSDRAAGFFIIPFAYANPGSIREPRIVKTIFETASPGAGTASCDRVRAPGLPPAEQACEHLQGRSCGPAGAAIPCTFAGGGQGQCECVDTWRCR